MVLKICPVFVSVSKSTSAELNYKEFAEINQHHNVEQSIRLLKNDAQSYTAMHAYSFKLENWRAFYPE